MSHGWTLSRRDWTKSRSMQARLSFGACERTASTEASEQIAVGRVLENCLLCLACIAGRFVAYGTRGSPKDEPQLGEQIRVGIRERTGGGTDTRSVSMNHGRVKD